MANSPEAFRNNCKALLEQTGWTQAELADRLGVSRPNVSKYLSGDTTPGLEVLDRFATAFGVSPAALVDQEIPVARIMPTTVDVPSQIRLAIEEAIDSRLGPAHYLRAAESSGPHAEVRSLLLAELDALPSLDEEQAGLLFTALEELRRMRPAPKSTQLPKKPHKPKR